VDAAHAELKPLEVRDGSGQVVYYLIPSLALEQLLKEKQGALAALSQLLQAIRELADGRDLTEHAVQRCYLLAKGLSEEHGLNLNLDALQKGGPDRELIETVGRRMVAGGKRVSLEQHEAMRAKVTELAATKELSEEDLRAVFKEVMGGER
jgi:hypothetical protein